MTKKLEKREYELKIISKREQEFVLQIEDLTKKAKSYEKSYKK